MQLSQEDINAIAKAVVESMDERIIAVVKTKLQLALGVDCFDNDDLVRVRQAVEFADTMRKSTETMKSRVFFGLWGFVAAVIIAIAGAAANHALNK